MSSQKLEIERKQHKLLEAHYNDAIPLNILASEQKSLDTQLANINKELTALTTDLSESEKLITMALDLAQDSASAYHRAPEHIKRMFNQIIFERIEVLMNNDDNHQLRAVLAPPFDELFSPTLKQIVNSLKRQKIEKKIAPPSLAGLSLIIIQFLMPLFLIRAQWSG